jgi:hypothetical protein
VVAWLRSFDVAEVLLRGREGDGSTAAATEVEVLPAKDDGAWVPECAPHGREIPVGQQVERGPLDPVRAILSTRLHGSILPPRMSSQAGSDTPRPPRDMPLVPGA